MSASPADGERSSGFTIEPVNKRLEANRALIESVMDRGITLSFLGEVDLTEIDKIRSQSWTRPHISYMAFVVKAVALAIRDFPDANRRVFQSGFGPFARSSLCSFKARDVAVTVERDLPGIEVSTLVEIIRDADLMPLDQITTTVQALNRAEANSNPLWRESSRSTGRFPAWFARRMLRRCLASPGLWVEQRGGAVLIYSTPREAVDAVHGTSSYPIGVSFGVVRPRPVVVEGAVVARSTFLLSMNFDRRVVTGTLAARLFKRIVAILEKPTREMDDFREKDPAPKHAVPVSVPREPRLQASGATIEPPPTRAEFPTIEADEIPESERSIEPPRTRDDFPTIGE